MPVAAGSTLTTATVIIALLASAPARAGDLIVTCGEGSGHAVIAGRGAVPLPALEGDLRGEVTVELRRSPLGLAERAATVSIAPTDRATLDLCVANPVATPASLGPAVGDLFIDAGTPGATVRVDGVEVGAAPTMLRGVATGAHVVEVRGAPGAGGCGRASQVVNVAAGAIARAEMKLDEAPGALRLQGRPEGAVVVVDGASAGTLPMEIPELSCGPHRVEVGETGFVTDGRDIVVHAGALLDLDVDLAVEERGSLTIDVVPLSASVHLDGTPLGTGPRTLENILAGPHDLRAEADGYRPLDLAVTVQPGTNARAELALRRSSNAGRVALNVAVTAVGMGAAVGSIASFIASEKAFEAFLHETDDAEAQRIYDEDVRPADTAGWALAAGAVAGLGGGVALWTLSVAPVPSFTARF